eukprot:TRINITY_DN9414_c0_g4_i1.p1 TRINITY_DN9414_c0_g4~~TRINITY_DN9414_c0_g4_i1.p1  ORF type:complete len:143 (+),score=29.45 TRINITY_DN9414_c0_g4_i1:245-673(+)
MTLWPYFSTACIRYSRSIYTLTMATNSAATTLPPVTKDSAPTKPEGVENYRVKEEDKMNELQSNSISNIENDKAKARKHINDLAEGKHKEGKAEKLADEKNMADHVQDAWDSTKQTLAKGVQYLDPGSKSKREAGESHQASH